MVAGGGNPPRRPDQAMRSLTRGGAPAPAPNVFRQIIIVGPTGDLLVYNPAVAPGDLIASISAQKTVDSQGNVVLQGITSYGTADSSAVQINGIGVNWLATSGSPEFNEPVGSIFYEGTSNLWLFQPGDALGLGITDGTQAGSMIFLTASGDTTGNDDTARIAAAFALVPTVVLVPGNWFLASRIEVDTNQTIQGSYGAIIEPGSNFTDTYMAGLASPASTTRATFRDLFFSIDWAANTTAGTIGGVQIDNTGWTSPGGRNQQPDPAHVLQGIRIIRASGDSYHFDNKARELRVENCTQYDGLGFGFYLGDSAGAGSGCTDSHFSDCTSGQSALNGWEVLDANNHFTNCKGFGSGNNVQTGVFGSTEYNWHLSGSHCVNNVFAGCSGQQAGLHGWFLDSCSQCAIVGCDSDSNGSGDSVPTGYGFLVSDAVSCTITGCSGEQSITPGNQVYGIAVQNTNTGTYIAFNPCKGTGGTFTFLSGSGYYLLDAPTITDFTNFQEVRFGAIELYQGNSAPVTLGNGSHIGPDNSQGTYPFKTSGANQTGITLGAWPAGGGAIITLVNTDATHQIAFAAAGTSNVAGGAAVAILAQTSLVLVWESSTALWYPASPA